ncbi:TlpA disulfide reductase family protein [Aureisphaera galaxeae]|uniref:TlpA disulfide reductase family protein n=1 Tax=Aureisphaera galaxeae TaxID=1538023 RepID=UPI002350F35B|nr:TlpA disulfide reductase family protein [Aureisphaera galaxeae]MDC8004429.1 TlpA disulfide reductase family protein [Aureisphaera galaxeae]
MKFLSLCSLALLLFLGCKETPEKEAAENVASVETEIQENPPVASSLIPTYNFDELEETYFKVESDSTYVINFWATWCKPCVKELPAFEQLRENHAANKVKVVLVSLDFPEHVEKAVIPFIEKKGLESEVVLLDDPDANTWIPKVNPKWSGAIPATIILNKEKSKFYEQSFTYEELEKEVISL